MNQTALSLDLRAGRRPAPTHGPRPIQDCPGGCGHQVAVELISCRSCWYRLPLALRQSIHARCRRAAASRAAAVLVVRAWFRREATAHA